MSMHRSNVPKRVEITENSALKDRLVTSSDGKYHKVTLYTPDMISYNIYVKKRSIFRQNKLTRPLVII